MAHCECTFAEVGVDCVLSSLEEWTPCFSIICDECFHDISFDFDHECVDLSKEIILLGMVDVLTTPLVCDQIYQKFTESHTDSIDILHKFLTTYKKMMTDSECKDRIRLILWVKDTLHPWTCTNKDLHSFQL